MNHISTDNLGNQYLSGSEKLIENLIGIMGETTEDVCYRNKNLEKQVLQT